MTDQRISDELLGYTIGVTADRRSDDLIAALIRRGAGVLHAPTLRIRAVEHDDHLLADTRAVIGAGPDYVLATTAHGFRAWLEAADAAGLGRALTQVLERSAILVRGPKARGAVRAAGLRERGSGSEETTAALVDLAIGCGVVGRTVVVQLHGHVDHDQLRRLEAAGARVLTVTPYRWTEPVDTRPVERLIEAISLRQLQAVTFTSAPAAEALLRAAERTGRIDRLLAALGSGVLPVAVGPVTAEPLRKAGLEPLYPDRYRLGAMVRALSEELSARALRFKTPAGSVELHGRRAIVGEHSALLSPAGAAILSSLIKAGGAVVTREQLRAVLPGAGDDHALEVAVGRLRGSLRAPRLVTTVVRRGYQLAGRPGSGEPE